MVERLSISSSAPIIELLLGVELNAVQWSSSGLKSSKLLKGTFANAMSLALMDPCFVPRGIAKCPLPEFSLITGND